MEDRSVTDLFAEYLDAKERGENPDFEALCAAHSDAADSLRALHSEQLRLEAVLNHHQTILSAASGEPSRWKEYLEKLTKLGPPSARYVRGAELNAGGMGAIHRVADPLLERRLVVKLMHGDASTGDEHGPTPRSDDKSLGRFLEEAKITARLDHPYIVPVHDIGLDESGRVYFAMKHVRGEDLRGIFDRIHGNDPEWSMTRGVQVMLKVCEAMAYAHAKGVIHRDLKPGNVMVGKFGEVYVMDWGLARILGEADSKDLRICEDTSQSVLKSERQSKHTATGSTLDSPLITMDGDVMGTPAYMPLEQAEGNLALIGPRADIYAVGAMLYHLLAETMPYTGKGERVSQRVIWQRVKSRPPRPLHELAPLAPAELIAIVEKAMARDAKDRYPDMQALAADLQAYLDVKVVSAYEAGAIAELKKWVQRNPALAAAAGLLVVVLAGATAIVSQQKREVEARNLALGEANNEISAQKNVAISRKAEFDQLAGVVYLEAAAKKEAGFFPAWPDKIAAMEAWLTNDASRLITMKPALEQTLRDLEAGALPQSEEDRAADRAVHPKRAELESKRKRIAWLRQRLAILAAPSSLRLSPIPQNLADKPASELASLAWERVNKNFSKRIFGEESLALACAIEAVRKIESIERTADLADALDTLAWAYFANGRDTEALAAADRAAASASEAEKKSFAMFRMSLEKAIAAYSGEAGAKALADLESEADMLDREVSSRQTWKFNEDSQQFLHSTLSKLRSDIDSFESGAKADVEQRLAWARQIGDLTLHHPNARVTWDDARAAIIKSDDVVASKLYAQSPSAPIDLKPQMGLVPIGMNPTTKLWEFYDLRSACNAFAGQDPAKLEIPTHRKDGSIEVRDETGIVFVLLPGGTFLQGAQKVDPTGDHYDPRAYSLESLNDAPVRVTLDPFLLAKFETTQGQWLRLSGANPSDWARTNASSTGLDHPIENVSWDDCVALAYRNGLCLPTEARWEFGCRAGTATAYSFGSDETEMTRYGNVCDQTYGRVFKNAEPGSFEPFDDGEGIPCRVGRYVGNVFGLFDMHGNVSEWCEDLYGRYTAVVREGDGLRTQDSTSLRTYRGGSYFDRAIDARSSSRYRDNPGLRVSILGARFARNLIRD